MVLTVLQRYSVAAVDYSGVDSVAAVDYSGVDSGVDSVAAVDYSGVDSVAAVDYSGRLQCYSVAALQCCSSRLQWC